MQQKTAYLNKNTANYEKLRHYFEKYNACKLSQNC